MLGPVAFHRTDIVPAVPKGGRVMLQSIVVGSPGPVVIGIVSMIVVAGAAGTGARPPRRAPIRVIRISILPFAQRRSPRASFESLVTANGSISSRARKVESYDRVIRLSKEVCEGGGAVLSRQRRLDEQVIVAIDV